MVLETFILERISKNIIIPIDRIENLLNRIELDNLCPLHKLMGSVPHSYRRYLIG